MGIAILFIAIIVFICTQTKSSIDDKNHRKKNPWKNNMTEEEEKEWLIREAEISQEEGWKKLGL